MEISNIQSQLEVIRPKARFNPMSPRKSKINGGGGNQLSSLSYLVIPKPYQLGKWSFEV